MWCDEWLWLWFWSCFCNWKVCPNEENSHPLDILQIKFLVLPRRQGNQFCNSATAHSLWDPTYKVSQKKWCVSLLQQQANAPFFWGHPVAVVAYLHLHLHECFFVHHENTILQQMSLYLSCWRPPMTSSLYNQPSRYLSLAPTLTPYSAFQTRLH